MDSVIDGVEATEEDSAPPTALEDMALVKRIKCWVKEDEEAHGKWRDQARRCFRFTAGDQWEADEKSKLDELGRAPVVFNRVSPIIDAVGGAEVANRTEARLIPREAGDGRMAEVQNAAIKWVRENCDAEDEESDAFIDVLTCGMGWTEHRLDYDADPDGMIVVERLDPLEMRWDPMARRRNLADKSWVIRESLRSREWIEVTFPEFDVSQLTDAPRPDSAPDTEGEPSVNDPIAYRGPDEGASRPAGMHRVWQAQWIEHEPYVLMISPESGERVQIAPERVEGIVDMYRERGVPVQMSPILQRIRYRQAFVVEDLLLHRGDAPSQDGWTLQAITGKRDRATNTWHGLVRPMIDPQKWANKFFSQLLHMVNSNAKGGLVVEDGSIPDRRAFERDWARADSIVTVAPGTISQGRLQPKPVPQFPSQPEALMTFSVTSIRDVSGVNLEMLGMAAREQPGILEAERKRSAMMLLSPLFDALRLYRKRSTRVLLGMIRDYISDGRLIRVVGQQGAQYVPLTKAPDATKYDVIVDDAPSSNDVRERSWVAINALMPVMQAAGVPVPPEIFEYAPIPASLSEQLRTAMVQAQQAPKQPSPEMQALQMQQQIEAMKAKTGAELKQLQIEADARIAALEGQIELQKQQMSLVIERQKAADRLAFEREATRDEIAADIETARFKARADVEKAVLVEQIRNSGRQPVDRQEVTR